MDDKTKEIGDLFLMAGYILSNGEADIPINIKDAAELIKLMGPEELRRNVRMINERKNH